MSPVSKRGAIFIGATTAGNTHRYVIVENMILYFYIHDTNKTYYC